MTQFAQRLLTRCSPRVGAVAAALRILTENYGYWNSQVRQRPCDAQGRLLPWMTYPALAFFDTLDLSRARLFEYGAGWGTLYWAARCSEVVSVDDKQPWVDLIQPQLPEHARLLGPLSGEAYVVSALSGHPPFDVVVVDGAQRLECARMACQMVNETGFIVLDNSDWFTEAADYLRSQGRQQIDFQGFGPLNGYTWTTSIFIGPGTILQRLAKPWSGKTPGSIPYRP